MNLRENVDSEGAHSIEVVRVLIRQAFTEDQHAAKDENAPFLSFAAGNSSATDFTSKPNQAMPARVPMPSVGYAIFKPLLHCLVRAVDNH